MDTSKDIREKLMDWLNEWACCLDDGQEKAAEKQLNKILEGLEKEKKE